MANFDRIYDSLHKSEKRKAELEAKIKPLEETIIKLESDTDRLRTELEQTNRERLTFSKDLASIAQTKEALQQENTTLRETMHHMQQALKTANQEKSTLQTACLNEKQQLIEALEHANDRYATYRGLLQATECSATEEVNASAGGGVQEDIQASEIGQHEALRMQIIQARQERDAAQKLAESLQQELASATSAKATTDRHCQEFDERFQQSQEGFAAWAEAVRQFINLCGISEEDLERHLVCTGFGEPGSDELESCDTNFLTPASKE